MKIIYLSNQRFEYENLSDLKSEIAKREIEIGDGGENWRWGENFGTIYYI